MARKTTQRNFVQTLERKVLLRAEKGLERILG